MGSLRDSDLRRTATTAPRPVGRVDAAYAGITATVLRKVGDTWEYDEAEEPIEVWPNRLLELQAWEKRLYWAGIEVRSAGRRFTNWHVTAALDPGVSDWTATGRLRAAPKGSRAEREEAIRRVLEAGGSLRQLTYDPFQQDRGWRTARLEDPMRLAWERGQLLGNGYVYGTGLSRIPREASRSPYWFFGLCQQPDEVLAHYEGKAPQLAILQAMAGRAGGDTSTFEERLRKLERQGRRRA